MNLVESDTFEDECGKFITPAPANPVLEATTTTSSTGRPMVQPSLFLLTTLSILYLS